MVDLPPEELKRQHRQTVYSIMQRNADRHAELEGAYGRWIVSTLTVLNAGSLAALLSYVAAAKASLWILGGGGWFMFGVILSLLCGVFSWKYFAKMREGYEAWADPRMIAGDDYLPKQSFSTAPAIERLGTLCTLTGWTAAILWIAGVIHVALSLVAAAIC